MADRSDAPRSPSLTGLFLRAWWMLFGNAALGIVLALRALGRSEPLSLLDVAFAALVASLVAARLADIRWFGGLTAEGARATLAHFQRYALRLLAGSAAGWGVASSLAAL
jgi:hypothetical protein